jgi:hypothetical protein
LALKHIVKIFIITAGFILLFNINSFAFIDAAAWGGYIFKGKVENDSSAEPKGGQYGIKAHYNTSLVPLLEIGLGGYYQYAKITYDVLNKDSDFERQTAGFDVNLILTLPVIHPYLRGTYAIWDKIEDEKENFKAYGAGVGVEITIFPLIRIFGEYMFENTEHDTYLRTNAANLGIKIDF